MTTNTKLRQGTAAWLEMVGTLMSEAAALSGLSPELNVSLVERYTDGVELSVGLVQGIRFDIISGKPSFRVGVRLDEQGDITIEITAAAARRMNLLGSADPHHRTALDTFLRSGEMRVHGDLARLGGWLNAVHDRIVDRTI